MPHPDTWLDDNTLAAMSEPEQMAYVRSHLADPWWRLNNLYKIEDEAGQLVTFKMRPAQRELFEAMWTMNLILKARQLGFSTAIDIYLLDQALFGENLKCGIIAQDQSAAGEIFRTKIEIPFDSLPGWLKAEFPVTSRRSGATGGYILFRHGSSIQVATSFRSGTVQRLHVSEHGKICAKYPMKAKEVRTGTLNAIHQGCIVFIESTAEGVGGDYHSMCMQALELSKAGASLSPLDYRFHFYAWYQDPKYVLTLPASGLSLSMDQEQYFAGVEQAMGITLTDQQKHWYVTKERSQGAEMKQEFPSTPLEAFLTSGRRVFDPTHVMLAEGGTTPPLLVYDLDPVTGERHKQARVGEGNRDQFMKTLEGRLLVWELPDPDEQYAIGADVAEGLEHGDRSSMDVVKKSTGEQVAHWFGHLDPSLFASLLRHVGEWYHGAYIGPERNNHGHAVLQALRDIYPARRIYAEQYLDRDNDDETPKLGWLTTKQSKPVLIDGLKTLLREEAAGIRWIGTCHEAHTYVHDAKGSANAQQGCFDDQLISYMIAQEMRARMPDLSRADDFTRDKTSHWMTH
ncbi:hypothetical protein HNR62_001040 [Oceanisphaera litoralis]|uniref:terminase n=1 Tax=Oceanisphaera litoralis TaxID=225144 RepID=UPI00195CB2D2|nr:terminase [Oceanisphaera litoralis]MBM7455180.1 hypothetical protein [Oceanisphaera litoralis]